MKNMTKKQLRKELKKAQKELFKIGLVIMAKSAESAMLHKTNDALMIENRKLKLKSEIRIALLEESEKEMIKQDAVIEHYEDKLKAKNKK